MKILKCQDLVSSEHHAFCIRKTLICLLAYSLMLCSHIVSCSVISDSVTPWTVAHQAPLSMEFSRQKYWSGLPFLSPGNLPNPEIEPRSHVLQADSLPSEPLGKLIVDLWTGARGVGKSSCTSQGRFNLLQEETTAQISGWNTTKVYFLLTMCP